MNDPFIANELLSDASALRERMDHDGYLFLRGILDTDVLARIRARIVDIWCSPDVPDPASAQAKLYGLEAVHRFYHAPPVTTIAESLIGEPIIPHVHKQVRVQAPAWPGVVPRISATHQDFVYNQGTSAVYTCWVPLSDLPAGRGGLEVLRGGHKNGVYEVQAPTPGSGTLSLGEKVDLADEWVRPAYHVGDAIFFHSLTPHRAPANRTACLRMSLDCRYQALSQPFSAPLLTPLPGVEEAYATWESTELQYYWKKLDLKVVAYDPSYFEKAGVGAPVKVE